jgi:hypothetical protein
MYLNSEMEAGMGRIAFLGGDYWYGMVRDNGTYLMVFPCMFAVGVIFQALVAFRLALRFFGGMTARFKSLVVSTVASVRLRYVLNRSKIWGFGPFCALFKC